jgi:hypothetical protein
MLLQLKLPLMVPLPLQFTHARHSVPTSVPLVF